MKISIKNFKSIGSLADYEIRPLTVLSGNNSTGKSSFIQLLLLLKQTIDIDFGKYVLYIDGEYFSAENYTDLIRGKNKANKLELKFVITKPEFRQFGARVLPSILDGLPDYVCELSVVYDFQGDDLYIEQFVLRYIAGERDYHIKFVQSGNTDVPLQMETNTDFFLRSTYDGEPTYAELSYSSIFPNSFDIILKETAENQKGENITNEKRVNERPNLASLKSYFQVFFEEFYYIGPVRAEPRDGYLIPRYKDSVGIKGEYVAKVLDSRKSEQIQFLRPNFKKDGIEFQESKVSLLEATNFWICGTFKFGKELFTKKQGEYYSIFLLSPAGIETTIKHVGFGVSQILPIIVQGLVMPPGGTLVLEQPEIHLHPKIQSLLFDFLYSLILQGKNVIIETHSDHFITRMRRRVAEDEESVLKDKIKLTFVEQGTTDLIFKSLTLDEYGILNIFPEDFIEMPELELEAIIKAQMKKRISNEP